MSFDDSSALAWLALAAPILLAHLYRPRRAELPVPSLRLWEEVLREEEGSFALRRMHRWASLVLQLAVLLVLVSLLAGPRLSGWTHEPRRYVLHLETRLRMAADHRMDRAKEHLSHSLSRLHPSDPVALSDSRGIRVPFTLDRDRILSVISAPVRWADSERSVVSGLSRLHPDAVLLPASAWEPLPNAAVTNAWVESGRIRVKLDGFGVSGDVTLDTEGNGASCGSTAAAVPGEGLVPVPKAERVRTAMRSPDAQPLDDAAYFVLPSDRAVRVHLLHDGKPDPLLLAAVRLLQDEGQAELAGILPCSRYGEIRGTADERTLFLVEGGTLEGMGAGVFACFGTRSAEWGTDGEETMPRVVEWDRLHPVLSGLNFVPLAIRRSDRPSRGREILRSSSGVLARAGGGPGRAWMAFGFRLAESDLRLHPAFPLLLRNLVTWVRSGAARSFETVVPSGGVLESRHPLDPPEGTAQILWTDGRAWTEENIRYREGNLHHPLMRPGFYRVVAGARTEWVAVPHAPATECDLREVSPPPRPPPELRWHERIPYAAAAGIALLLLLLVEWWLYQTGRI